MRFCKKSNVIVLSNYGIINIEGKMRGLVPFLALACHFDKKGNLDSEALEKLLWTKHQKRLGQPATWPIRVLLPDGTPAANAKVFLATRRDVLRINNGEVTSFPDEPIRTNADGIATIARRERHGPPIEWVAVLHDKGFAIAEASHKAPEIRLPAWQTLRGRIAVPRRSEWNTLIYFVHTFDEKHNRRNVAWTASVPVAADGTFVIDRLPEASVLVAQLLRPPAMGERGGMFNSRYQLPTLFTVPSQTPLVMGENCSTVTGRIAFPSRRSLPALVRLVPKNRQYTHRALTDKEGRFVISGVAEGNYDLVAYAVGEEAEMNDYATTAVLASVSVASGAADSSHLGTLHPYASPYALAIQNTITLPAGTLERIEAKAKELYSRPIEKITVAMTTRPDDTLAFAARVTYALQATPDDPTHGTQQTAIIELPFRYGMEMDDDFLNINALHATNEDFKAAKIHATDVRIFPLSSHKLALPLDKQTGYETALALLRTIERGALKMKQYSAPKRDGTIDWDAEKALRRRYAGNPPTSAILPQITAINYRDGTFEIRVRESVYRGKTYTIEKNDKDFIFVREASWRLGSD